MNEMVKRISEALSEQEGAICSGNTKTLARTALWAMREPTRAMICAVLDAHDANPRLTIAEDWRIMIDAALKE